MSTGAVSWSTLLQVAWVSVVAGVGVSTVFSIVILASARASESRRSGRDGAAVAFGALAALAFAMFCVGIVVGLNLMLSKD